MKISEKLKDARSAKNMTQEQVAEAIDITRVTLSHWETGKSLPDIESLISLSELYDISLDELVKGDIKMTEKVKRDSRNSKALEKIIITAGCIAAFAGIIYVISIFVGGAFKDFMGAAINWIIYGIALAAALAYISTKETKETK